MGRGRVWTTTDYRDWLQHAAMALRAAATRVGIEQYETARIHVAVTPGGHLPPLWDLDNVAKPALDAVVRAGLVADDTWRHVRVLDIYVSAGQAGDISITVESD
jgi:hypothetical protein